MNKCLKRRTTFRLLASYPNVEVKRYSCASLLLPWRYNYRLHDKYLIVDDSYYLLGGRSISDRSLGAAANRRLRHAGLFSTLSHTSIHSWKRHSTLPRAHLRPSACVCCTTRAGRRTRRRRSGTCSTGSHAKGACKRGFARESSSGRCAT